MSGQKKNSKKKHSKSRAKIRTITLLAVIAVPVVIGLALLGFSGPQGNSAAQAPLSSPTATPSAPKSSGSPQSHSLTRSAPMQLTIPAIGVGGRLLHLGLNADKKTVQLPGNPKRAGWYSQSATPGEAGPTIILGYIDSRKGPGIFHKLSALKVAAKVTVRRADGKAVTYQVDKIASYTAKNFPATQVYGKSAQSELRIVTCGGVLHRGQKPGNVVVFAHQVGVKA